ncbi:MAG: hypothetical protein F6K14_07730 [Symploca sp. SIO2C1]|nr:hypothetical protein [Symploca sp. SIO2C1]
MSTETQNTIWIITEASEIPVIDEEPTGDKDGIRDTGGTIGQPQQSIPKTAVPPRRGMPVAAQKLKQEMGKFVEVVGEVFSQTEQLRTGMQLEEIELSVEINGEGKVSLFGIGGKTGGKGAMTLKFKRQDSQ